MVDHSSSPPPHDEASGDALLDSAAEATANTSDPAVLRIESITWNRDSHELFDYESRHVFSKRYLVKKSARVFRSQLDVTVVADGHDLPQNADYLLSVKARDAKFFIYPADRNVCSPTSNLQPRKLWLIIKHLQRSSFPLGEGDVIKLGRFKLRVKQIVNNSASTSAVDFRLDDIDVPVTDLSPTESRSTQCRICLLEGGDEGDPLVRACQCKGSIMYVHLECLRHWVNGRLNLSDDPNRSCCFIRQITCELCKSTFPSSVSAGGSRLPVVKVPNVQPPFIVLENMVGPTNKGVHLCSMAAKKECKLGRGHESDVRIPDVSISRFHATIKFSDGIFHLEDHGSKFGTLVALRKPTMIERIEKLSVQVGRTVLKFSMEDPSLVLTEDLVELPEERTSGAVLWNESAEAAAIGAPGERKATVPPAAGGGGGAGGDAPQQQLLPNSNVNVRRNPIPAAEEMSDQPSHEAGAADPPPSAPPPPGQTTFPTAAGTLHPIYSWSASGENYTQVGYAVVPCPFHQGEAPSALNCQSAADFQGASLRHGITPTASPMALEEESSPPVVSASFPNPPPSVEGAATGGPTRLSPFGMQFTNQIYFPSPLLAAGAGVFEPAHPRQTPSIPSAQLVQPTANHGFPSGGTQNSQASANRPASNLPGGINAPVHALNSSSSAELSPE